MDIFQVDKLYAKAVFDSMLEDSINKFRDEALGWFKLNYETDIKPTDETRDDIEERSCAGAKCLIKRFKKLEVKKALVCCAPCIAQRTA